jgi:hypothetical protein
MHDPGQAHGCAFLCPAGHELRVTARCLGEDLNEDPNSEFDALCTRHGIVRAFRDRRQAETAGSDTVGPAAGHRTLTVVRHTHHYRGATWYEADEQVVWLCATGQHRSGQPDDAFQHFERLREANRIYPEDGDYIRLEEERAERFAILAHREAPRLLAEAQAQPGQEITIEIGPEPVSCVVHLVETMEERFVAISGYAGPQALILIRALLAPEQPLGDWRSEGRLPTRELDHSRAEMCWSIAVL